MRTLLLSLALLALAGCSSYEGPNFGGTWDAVAGVATTSQSLVLAHDPDATLDYELTGAFADAAGTTWPIEADPVEAHRLGEKLQFPPRAGGEWRITLRGGLLLVDDEGERTQYDVGPLQWSLAHHAAGGDEWLQLMVKPAERLLGVDPPPGPWRMVTFRRRGAPAPRPATLAPGTPASPAPTTSPAPPPQERCAGCGESLEARWTVCPVCARPRGY